MEGHFSTGQSPQWAVVPIIIIIIIIIIIFIYCNWVVTRKKKKYMKEIRRNYTLIIM